MINQPIEMNQQTDNPANQTSQQTNERMNTKKQKQVDGNGNNHMDKRSGDSTVFVNSFR